MTVLRWTILFDLHISGNEKQKFFVDTYQTNFLLCLSQANKSSSFHGIYNPYWLGPDLQCGSGFSLCCKSGSNLSLWCKSVSALLLWCESKRDEEGLDATSQIRSRIQLPLNNADPCGSRMTSLLVFSHIFEVSNRFRIQIAVHVWITHSS